METQDAKMMTRDSMELQDLAERRAADDTPWDVLPLGMSVTEGFVGVDGEAVPTDAGGAKGIAEEVGT